MGASNSKNKKKDGTAKAKRHIREGERLPLVNLKGRVRVKPGEDTDCFEWKDITTEDLFKGKRIVMFSVPGAFTPVCSCDHLPGYETHYKEVLALGIDDIFCISVNDSFVMRQWGIAQNLKEETDPASTAKFTLNPGNFQQVKLIPDGSARFTRAMGMSCNFESVGGYGERSWRYSAVINDMVVEKLFMEEGGAIKDDPSADPLQVSDVATMMQYLGLKNGQPMQNVPKQQQNEKGPAAAAANVMGETDD
jgi:peroxiredoxin